MAINKKGITNEQLMKAVQCKTADELMALAKAEGVELTKAEAEAYMTELSDVELDNDMLKKVAGGDCYHHWEHGRCGSYRISVGSGALPK